MSGVFWALIWVVIAIVGVFVTALVTPVRLGLILRTSPDPRVKVSARLFGGLTPTIPIHDSARARPRAKEPPAKRERPWAASRQRRGRVTRAIKAAPSLLVRLVRKFHVERLEIDANVGLDDPADTGLLFGVINALAYARPRSPRVSIAIRPDFTGLRASGKAEAELSFIPAAFVPPGLRFAWSVFRPGS